MSDFDFDLFVIGAGSGGVRTARMCSQQGMRVAIAESQYLGGTCVNVGCVPKKLFVYASSFAEEFRAAKGFGWQVGETHFDWPTLRENKNREIERLNSIYGNLLDNAKVTLIEGWASIIDPHTVEVNGLKYRCEKILSPQAAYLTSPIFPEVSSLLPPMTLFSWMHYPNKSLLSAVGILPWSLQASLMGLVSRLICFIAGPYS